VQPNQTSLDPATRAWWTLLRAGSLLNLLLLALLWLEPLPAQGAPLAQRLCASIYVGVCAFRSFLPRVDLERTVLVDHPLSSIALGRSAATLAEMAFTVQIALFVHRLAEQAQQPALTLLAIGIVPLIAVAQACCWRAVLTGNHRWHAAEELLWGIEMIAVGGAFALAWPLAGDLKPALALGIAGCAAGAWVMLVIDIPMYLRRYATERAAGIPLRGLGEGWRDAATRRVPAGDWATWRPEARWMTPYFTICTLLSLGMAVF
jgi:hypothetical protein